MEAKNETVYSGQGGGGQNIKCISF